MSSFSVSSSSDASRQRLRRSSVSAIRTAILWTQGGELTASLEGIQLIENAQAVFPVSLLQRVN
jgi:hypothetical protein